MSSRSRVGVQEATSGEMVDRALDLAETVWGRRPLDDAVVRALEFAGGYISVALDDGGAVVGMCLGFPGVHDDGLRLHSHLAAVDPARRGTGIGRELKRHQRTWCLDRGIETVTWTFDPLVSANGRFNLHHLGVTGTRYLTDLYGPMTDQINRGDPSDRVLVRWDLRSPLTIAALESPLPVRAMPDAVPTIRVGDDGEPAPVETDAAVRLVATPAEIVDLRRRDPDLARRWRLAVRDAMVRAFDDGLRPVAVVDQSYLCTRPEEDDR